MNTRIVWRLDDVPAQVIADLWGRPVVDTDGVVWLPRPAGLGAS